MQDELERERLRSVALAPVAVEATAAAGIAEELSNTLTWDRKPHRRHKGVAHRRWRTRKDPFESVAQEIQLAVKLQPSLQAKELFEQLCARHPGLFKGNERRTLQPAKPLTPDTLFDRR